jgi:hypothetical protein
VSGAALFFIIHRSVGKRGNTSSVVGHCILQYSILALVKTLIYRVVRSSVHSCLGVSKTVLEAKSRPGGLPDQ